MGTRKPEEAPIDLPILPLVRASHQQKGLSSSTSLGARTYVEGEPPVLCLGCMHPIEEGEQVTRIILGPGGDTYERLRARGGYPYTAVALELHLACATGQENL